MRSLRPLYWLYQRPLISASLICALFLTAAGISLASEDGGTLSGSIDDEEPTGISVTEGAVRFDAAMRLATSGQAHKAAAALVQLAQELPKDDLAAEALFEAGLLYEEHLADPEAARRSYSELGRRYAHSRVWRRAQQRLFELDAALRSGAAPLLAFQAILRTTADGSHERQNQLNAFFRSYPDVAFADQTLFLLAETALRLSNFSATERHLAELYRRFPHSSWAAQGHRLQAEALLQARHIAAARQHYIALQQFSGPLWPLVAREGLLTCEQASRQLYWALAAWGYLGLFGIAMLYRGHSGLWPPPIDVWYYAPIAGFLSFAALFLKSGQGAPLSAPIWQFGLGGGVLTWLAAAESVHGAKPQSRGALLLGLFLRALAAGALAYLIIYHHNLSDVLLETLQNGPES